ncbi:sensor histidine kinase [Pseudoleptotrichia goodfellowii]|uniref:Sensor with HAMP domain n=1 Tax=Pseudoleptotrichia goodfellowii TaxID=157692 RepID=A0A510JCR1_9FUSO|nr:sensor histidine kinase [Pseudoleptotrichia goodfellowii]BBM37090.1 sensor with HAMP domain [Pseudoleptotrichia goodfellowii]
MKLFKKSIRKSMTFKIIIYYLTGNFLFILFLSSIFYYSSKYIIMKKEIEATRKNAEKSAEYVSLYVDKLKNLINLLSVNTDIENTLINNSENSKVNVEKLIQMIITENKGNIKSITVIGKNGNIISNEKNVNMDISADMMKENWYISAINNTDKPVLNPIRKKQTSMDITSWVLSISKDIKDKNGENLGVIVFDIKYQALNEYLKDISMGEQNDNLIIDNKNNIIYYKDVNCFINKKCLDKFLSQNKEYYKNKNIALTKVNIGNTDWQLISFSEMNDLVLLKKSFFDVIIAIFLISLGFTTVVTFLIIRKFINPLRKLENHIQKFENSLSEFNTEKNTSYEIEVLVKHFNNMISRIKYLREYEIKALHSQINPHFLYNTLDTIIWMTEFGDSEQVITITKSLANFFRLSLSNGNEKISLKDEITHVKEYLFIQKQRYEDKLTYNFNIDSNLLSSEVPKIIIQPIVENSIYHGIKNIQGTGIIDINVYENNNDIYIAVKDNGIGFKKSEKFKKSKIGGVGIKNVDKRIKFYYGNEYGIEIKEISEGSCVILKLPRLK